MYKIVEIYGGIAEHIDKKGKANKYGEPKLFETKKEASAWIIKHSYVGMSHKYEIVEAE